MLARCELQAHAHRVRNCLGPEQVELLKAIGDPIIGSTLSVQVEGLCLCTQRLRLLLLLSLRLSFLLLLAQVWLRMQLAHSTAGCATIRHDYTILLNAWRFVPTFA